MKSTSADSTSSLTSGWKTLETQVGGHKFSHGEYDHQNLGILDLQNGFILKSLQKPPRGTRELNFYEEVFSPECKDKDLIEAREFLSPYGGMQEVNGAKFIRLKNLTSGFIKPCVADLKMGRVTYDQEASPEKIKHEVGKFPPLKNLGFQFTGMSLYNPKTGKTQKFEKSFCRSLTEKTIVTEGLGQFFGLPHLRRDVIQVLLKKLRRMESWFLKQKRFSFVASSLLMVYEGVSIHNSIAKTDSIRGPPVIKRSSEDIEDSSVISDPKRSKTDCADVNGGQTSPGVCDSSTVVEEDGLSDSKTKQLPLLADVHLIDFAHAFPASDIDQNFLFGLQKLISCMNELLQTEK